MRVDQLPATVKYWPTYHSVQSSKGSALMLE
jgi:hypothetical protein